MSWSLFKFDISVPVLKCLCVNHKINPIIIHQAGLIALVLSCVSAAPAGKDLPVLFQFAQPTHNVAVFRGADLKNAIAAGLVKGFGSGAGAGVVAAPAVAPVVKVAPRPAVIPAPVVRVAPVIKPAPVVVKAAPVVRAPVVVKTAPVVSSYAPAPAVTSYAPATVAYKPAPKVAYKPYVDPYADEPAVYSYEYAVKDDYSAADFGAAESRDNYLTTGKYVVALPDGRVQTVSYTVDGGNGYVADVVYSGQAQYPDAPAPGYTA